MNGLYFVEQINLILRFLNLFLFFFLILFFLLRFTHDTFGLLVRWNERLDLNFRSNFAYFESFFIGTEVLWEGDVKNFRQHNCI
jgi:hypothetical protein